MVKTLLLCDTLHLVGFKLYDRKRMEEDKKKENKHRLLGFESKQKAKESDQFNEASPQLNPTKNLTESPKKPKKENEQAMIEKFKNAKDKIVIPSFLDGFNALTEDDLDIMAEFEEEQRRIGHYELIFPTKETIDSLGPYFESQRHANLVLWQYIKQKQPI